MSADGRWRKAVATAFGALAIAASFGAGHLTGVQKEVRTERLVLVDKDGAEAAVLEVDADGHTVLVMNSEGARRIELRSQPGVAGIALFDPDGTGRGIFAAGTDSMAQIKFADPSGQTRAIFGYNDLAGPEMIMLHGTGGVVMKLPPGR